MKEGETVGNTPDLNKIYTYADWKTWEGRWELINGKAYNMTPAPSSEHQFAVGELYFALRHFFQNKHCYVFMAPFDVFLSKNETYETPDDIVQPDIAVICNKKQIVQKGCYGAPALVVEVLSPSTALKDYNEKFYTYQHYGIAEYWIVDTANKMIHVYHLHEGAYQRHATYGQQDTLHSAQFEDLAIPLTYVFGWS
ncbi:Uma2 family endonuclease [Geobacillus stearothermophilus]|nr:Uma2 family endonuclease [Geobacillus stearothermophilus]QOR85534.1 Uma2 family endonuclease [Geobacillus stearothermophilus]